MKVVRTRARKLWFPYRGLGARWFGRGVVIVPPRLVQLLAIAYCRIREHELGQWRIETSDWFEYVPGPQPWAWHACSRCGLIERCLPEEGASDVRVQQ